VGIAGSLIRRFGSPLWCRAGDDAGGWLGCGLANRQAAGQQAICRMDGQLEKLALGLAMFFAQATNVADRIPAEFYR
ncbi:hypothetical protein CKO35_17720, partial [Ectothiorhodospira shaposhnikovii]|uniref:hypothetical protein n=1 Tax=Ectothiorhodospira shaposhnikovii TaxID=1054 RepID=UPI001A918EF6